MIRKNSYLAKYNYLHVQIKTQQETIKSSNHNIKNGKCKVTNSIEMLSLNTLQTRIALSIRFAELLQHGPVSKDNPS